MPRDNICMYMAHVCFYVGCTNCVGVCGKIVVLQLLLNIFFLSCSVEVCCMFV